MLQRYLHSTILVFVCSVGAMAQTEIILHSFAAGNDGYSPMGGLIAGKGGTLYGTTAIGGNYQSGTIFRLLPPNTPGGAWTYRNIYTFTGGSGGALPYAHLTIHNGSLYGTTLMGGAHGCGVVFQLTPPVVQGDAWTYQVLYAFAGGSDGSSSYSPVVFDASGAMYGTTFGGGTGSYCPDGCGTVFKLLPPVPPGGAWTETILYRFTGGSDGGRPPDGLVFDKAGVLYGVTEDGGAFYSGTVFQLGPPVNPDGTWTESVLHSFKGGRDGMQPRGTPVFDRSGNLYGVTQEGGTSDSNLAGYGVVYKLAPPVLPGDTWTERILHGFEDGADGRSPAGSLTISPDGSLYGTTSYGGSGTHDCALGTSCGVVFKLLRPVRPSDPWMENILYNFNSTPDGASPYRDLLVLADDGTLYGVTAWGGTCTWGTCGTVFSIAP